MDSPVTEMFVVISVMKQVKVVTKNDNGHWQESTWTLGSDR